MRIGQFDENYKKKTTPFYEENTSKCLLQLPISAFIKKTLFSEIIETRDARGGALGPRGGAGRGKSKSLRGVG